METASNIKKLRIRLRILYSDVIDYNRGSFFGVKAMEPEVLHLWFEFNSILPELDTTYPSMFKNFHDLPYPVPHIANADSFYKEGTMIYKPEHFAPLRLAIEKILEMVNKIKIEESSLNSNRHDRKNCA